MRATNPCALAPATTRAFFLESSTELNPIIVQALREYNEVRQMAREGRIGRGAVDKYRERVRLVYRTLRAAGCAVV